LQVKTAKLLFVGFALCMAVTMLSGRASAREKQWLAVTAREAVVYSGLNRGDRGWRVGQGLVLENLGKHEKHDWYKVGLRNGLKGWIKGWLVKEILSEQVGEEFEHKTPRVKKKPQPVAMIADHVWLRTEPDPRGSGLTDHGRFVLLQNGDRALAVEQDGHWTRLELGGGVSGWVFDEFLVSVKSLPQPGALTAAELTDGRHAVLFLTFKGSFPHAVVRDSFKGDRLTLTFLGAKAEGLELPAALVESPLAAIESRPVESGLELSVKMRRPLTGYYRERIGDRLALILRFMPEIDPKKPLKGLRICLDPGHGDITYGLADGTKNEKLDIWERDAVLAIALELEKLLTAEGAEVLLTRRVNGPEMNNLTDRIEAGIDFSADVFLSLHLNGGPDYRFGSETYFHDRLSMPLAWFVLEGVSESLETRFNYSTYASFAVLRETRFPGALVEFLYLSRDDEALAAKEDDFTQRAAEGVRDGLLKYILALSEADLTPGGDTVVEGFYPFWDRGTDE